ncbi:MAG: MBL fold metallo-hydrolase [Firmicutes bacterium]|nr:MBL fold metallo-hydrolase [Bacillota bacterium]
MNTHFTFHKGIRTIGGTIIELAEDGYRLIFDMGRGFAPGAPGFDHDLQPRDIRDLQRLDIAPKLPGVFDDASESDGKTLIAVSHMHLDHMGFFPYLREDVPVLLTHDSLRLLQGLDAVHDGPRRSLSFVPVSYDEPYTFGPFTIEALAVDHDCPGACAFLITTGDLRFVYSGDLRLHGSHPEWTRTFALRARDFRPDVLFIEGTRAEADDNSTTIAEPELAGRIAATVQAHAGGAYLLFYPRHPERVASFMQAANACGRQLVLQPHSAYLFEHMGGQLENVRLYGGMAKSWTEHLTAWVRKRGLDVIHPNELAGHEHSFLVEITYPQLVDFVDIEPARDGVFMHVGGTPLGAYDPAWHNLMHWLDIFGLAFASLGSTGHGSRSDILSIAETIAPSVLMPIHSHHPERIGLTSVRRIMPAYHRVYSREDILRASFPAQSELAPDES